MIWNTKIAGKAEKRESRNRSKWTFYVQSECNSEDALWLKLGQKSGRVEAASKKGRAWGPLTVPASSQSWRTGPRSGEEIWHKSRKGYGFDSGVDMLSLLSSLILHLCSLWAAVSRHDTSHPLIYYFTMTALRNAPPLHLSPVSLRLHSENRSSTLEDKRTVNK